MRHHVPYIHLSSAGEVFIYTMPEKYLYTSPASDKYLYTPEKYLYIPPEKYLYISPAPEKPERFLYTPLIAEHCVCEGLAQGPYTATVSDEGCIKILLRLLRLIRAGEVYKYFSGGAYKYFSGVYKYFSGAEEVYKYFSGMVCINTSPALEKCI